MINLNSNTVLCLNAGYMRLGWCSVSDAFIAMMSEGADGTAPAKAVDISYDYDEYGKPITEKWVAIADYDWDRWLAVEPRKGDLDKVIHTSKRIIRVPTIIVKTKYSLMHQKEAKPTPSAIRRRDGNRCQYTGVELTNKTFSLDHIVPRSKGGKDNWQNLVSCHKDVNSEKGNKWNHEAGLKLKRQPFAPKSIPLCATVVGQHHVDHFHF